MSDRRKRRRKSSAWVWIWSCIGIFFILSFPLGFYIDMYIIFPPSREVQGHGMPIFMILLPLLAIGLSVVTAVIGLILKLVKVLSHRSEHFEYLKITANVSDENTPFQTLHEIDLDAGRCSTRCIQIYRNGYVACLMNPGMYAPIPTAAFINVSNAMPPQRADIVSGREFEELWTYRRYPEPSALTRKL